jgi:MATE family multidrug resistance protein
MGDKRNWWNRPCGPRDILAISLPLIASTISYTVMQFCDRMFLSWDSNDALAAALPAGVVSWTLMSLPLGIASYASTFVAQFFGAEQQDKIGPVIWQAIWMSLCCIPLFILFGIFGEQMFLAMGHPERLSSLESAYFLALSFGSGAAVLDAGISSFFIGRGKTKVVMLVNIFGAALNVLLDYLLIFGVGMIPALGIWGAGLATSISVWCKVAIFAYLFLHKNNAVFANRTGYRFQANLMKRFLLFGVPNGLQYVIEGFAITFFVIIIARISEAASAASSVVFSINMLVFYPVIGLGMGCSTLVGQKIGESRPDEAARATWNTLLIGVVYTLLFAFAYFQFPKLFLHFHSTQSQDFEEIRGITITFLKFVAVFCLFDTVQIVFVSAIKGAGDTRFVVFATIISATVFLVVGNAGNTFTEPMDQVNWWWVCLTGWIFLLSLIYMLRFLLGPWKSMTVLEPALSK